jgi:hypothetical protein
MHGLLSLPDEILQQCLAQCEIADLLAAVDTCSVLRAVLSADATVWVPAIRRAAMAYMVWTGSIGPSLAQAGQIEAARRLAAPLRLLPARRNTPSASTWAVVRRRSHKADARAERQAFRFLPRRLILDSLETPRLPSSAWQSLCRSRFIPSCLYRPPHSGAQQADEGISWKSRFYQYAPL